MENNNDKKILAVDLVANESDLSTHSSYRQLCEMSFICWEESLLNKYPNEDLKSILFKLIYFSGCSDYAYIIHNNDFDNNVQKKVHIHFILRFYKKVSCDRIGKLFCISPSLIQKLENVRYMLRYFTHIDYIDKTQYDISSIVSNIPNYKELINTNLTEYALALRFCINIICEYKKSHNDSPSFMYVINLLVSNGYESFIKRSAYIIKNLL